MGQEQSKIVKICEKQSKMGRKQAKAVKNCKKIVKKLIENGKKNSEK